MYSGEFLHLLEQNIHPRWWTIWVECNRWGRRQREAAGLTPDLGTVFVARAQKGEAVQALIVPTNCLPYITTYETILDEDGKETLGYQAAKGWPASIEHLVKHWYLRPSRRLSYLIGKDTFQLAAEGGPEGEWDDPDTPDNLPFL